MLHGVREGGLHRLTAYAALLCIWLIFANLVRYVLVRLLRFSMSMLCFATALGLGAEILQVEVFSNARTANAVADVREVSKTAWGSSGKLPSPSPDTVQATSGKAAAVALLSIPSLRSRVWEYPVLAGTHESVLASGVGLFSGRPQPGEPGNVAILGHRTSYGRPFSDFSRLRKDDLVVFESGESWFVYRLLRNFVVRADETWVLGESSRVMGRSTHVVSLITCTPKGSTSHRWVWQGTLTHALPKNPGDTPKSVLASLANQAQRLG